jgi:hypothetical protein
MQYITREPKALLKLYMWELSSTIDPNKISKLAIYTQNKSLPPGACSGHCIQSLTSTSSSVMLHLHPYVRRKIWLVWALQKNPLTGELCANNLPPWPTFPCLPFMGWNEVSTTSPFPLTTLIGIGMKYDTHECSRIRSRLLEVNLDASRPHCSSYVKNTGALGF